MRWRVVGFSMVLQVKGGRCGGVLLGSLLRLLGLLTRACAWISTSATSANPAPNIDTSDLSGSTIGKSVTGTSRRCVGALSRIVPLEAGWVALAISGSMAIYMDRSKLSTGFQQDW